MTRRRDNKASGPAHLAHPSEDSLQESAARFLDRHPATRGLWFHPPNEGSRSKLYAAALKRRGVKPGVPDIVVLRPPGLVIELKTQTGRLRTEQKAWLERLESVSVPTAVCRSIGEVVAAVEGVYGG